MFSRCSQGTQPSTTDPNAAPVRLTGMALVELGRYSQGEAHIVVGRLESEGIPAIAFDAGSSIADGSWLLIPVRVMVDEDDLTAARTITAV